MSDDPIVADLTAGRPDKMASDRNAAQPAARAPVAIKPNREASDRLTPPAPQRGPPGKSFEGDAPAVPEDGK